jgi:hypothetical protein
MKKPPSQRPERQGPHLHSVGSPYHPDRKMWPDGAQFNYRGGDLELVLFLNQPTPSQVKAVKTGRADFGLYDADGLAVLFYRFRHDLICVHSFRIGQRFPHGLAVGLGLARRQNLFPCEGDAIRNSGGVVAIRLDPLQRESRPKSLLNSRQP